ncbi:alpha-L-rhamnosidase [Truncatella angustata]|uniref:Alpha-L-rhamnosidase n=1 Tax=Truncatella angustata TaxID=152316 RepID=A0A9P8UBU5_9PEZI|nr:alpha-L-rhamnosidase [Truncatella angustata]KAH6646547.1 alpha-L-rhamnosidase [Truncatella angustata]
MWSSDWKVSIYLLSATLASSAAVPTYWMRLFEGDVFLPRGLSVGTDLSMNTGNVTAFTLSDDQPLATIDYGTERAGYPFFSITNVVQPVQIEVKYSEAFIGLSHPWADGPYTFATGLSNSFRVETFNITSSGRVVAPLIQGGQRWQSIQLLSEGATITFGEVGFDATVDTTEATEYPGQFECDDVQLNAIWKLGGAAASTACVEEGTQRTTWEIDGTSGAYIRSQRASQAISGASFENYTLTFDTMIERGGVWWAVAFPMGRGEGIHLQLVSELPEDATFLNVNNSLTPANSILLSWGYDFVNQTTLTSYYLNTFTLRSAVAQGVWHSIKTVLSPDGRLSVTLNDEEVIDVSLSEYYTPSAISFTGSFGFGAWQDQGAYIRNVEVTDSANGTTLYTNPMTSADVLIEHGTQGNLGSVCLDGPKRDRLVWLGDFYHTARIIGASTSRHDLIKGTLDFFLETQIADGEVNICPAMGYDPSITLPFTIKGRSYGLSDYQMLGLGSLYSYVRQTNDLVWLEENWPRWQSQAQWIIEQVNSTDGLIYVPSAFLGAASAGSAVSCLAVQSLREFSELAEAIGDTETQSRCTTAADGLSEAISNQLWNEDLGVFSLSASAKTDFSVAGIAFCITSGVSNSSQTMRTLAALDELALSPGYKDSTTANSSDPTVLISPNTNGFLLDALFKAEAWETGVSLVRSLWGAMISNPGTASGASWEYVDQNGDPGLGLFTSLAHPWGGAATYVLTEWAAGIQPAAGIAGFGYAHWIVSPDAGLAIGLKQAKATVKTPSGLLSVEWEMTSSDELQVKIDAPPATYGIFKLGNETKSLCGDTQYEMTIIIG